MFDEMALVVGRDLAMGSFVRQKPIERLDDLSIQIERIAVALERLTENQINWSDLYEEVMKIEGLMRLSLHLHLTIWYRTNWELGHSHRKMLDFAYNGWIVSSTKIFEINGLFLLRYRDIELLGWTILIMCVYG